MRATVAIACAALLAGATCGGPDVPPTRIEVVRRACLAEPPPTHPPIDAADLFAAECGSACLEARTELGLYLRRLQRFARDAWTLCGPEAGAEGDETP